MGSSNKITTSFASRGGNPYHEMMHAMILFWNRLNVVYHRGVLSFVLCGWNLCIVRLSLLCYRYRSGRDMVAYSFPSLLL